MTTQPPASGPTPAFFAQAAVSFGLSLLAVAVGVAFLPVDPWIRAFLAVAVLYTVTSAFTLAKVVRDRHEDTSLAHRVDRARVDKLIAEHDPFRVE